MSAAQAKSKQPARTRKTARATARRDDLVDMKQAIALLDQALTDESPKANRLASRAEALGKLQQWEAADADWKQSLNIQPNNETLRQRWLDSLTDGQRWPQIAGYYSEHGTEVPIPPEKNVISTVNIGVLSFTKSRSLAEKFVEFAVSAAGQVILAEHNYRIKPVE